MLQLSDQQWADFQRDGYLLLGQLLDPEEVAAMQRRLDDIMLGRADVDYDRMILQLEGEGGQYNQPGAQTRGFKKATLNHRVVYGLEYDPLFLRYLQRPLFRNICARAYGAATPIVTYRAFVMNKPARGGSDLGWHQDRWTFLEPDPLITLWTALDPASKANGCVKVIRSSHQRGVINPAHESGWLTTDQARDHCGDEVVYLELPAGHVALLHNWLLHASEINRTDLPRRGFSACYMVAATRDRRPPQRRDSLYDPSGYPPIFGPAALNPDTLPRGKAQASGPETPAGR